MASDHDRVRVLVPSIISALYRPIRTANEISRQFRATVHEGDGGDTKHLTYGEVNAESFVAVIGVALRSLPFLNGGLCFYDLGSGTGKGVMTVGLCFPLQFSRCCGIELVPGLHDVAVNVHRVLLTSLAEHSAPSSSSAAPPTPPPPPPSRKGSMKEPLTETQLVDKVLTILAGTEAPSTVETVGTSLAKLLGPKVYAASMKPWGKLSRFMAKQTHAWAVAADGTVTRVASFGGDAPTDVEDGEAGKEVRSDLPAPPSTPDDALPLLRDVFRKHPGAAAALVAQPPPRVDLVCGDIFEVPWWTDADVVYVASLLFSDALMAHLLEKLRLMRRPAAFVTLRPLPLADTDAPHIRLVEASFFKMSWQMAKCYFYVVSPS